jgi:Trk-type K+ transport system membrane component
MAIVALVSVGAVLGLVAAFRVLLWGGPAGLRWTVLGVANVALLIGSGRARVYTVLGGMILSGYAAWAGLDQDWTVRLDLVLTSLMMGMTIGAIAGAVWQAGQQRGRKDH